MSRSPTRVSVVRAGLLAGVALLPAVGCSQARPEPELQIVNVLNAQADAWNRGDLDAFLAHYWRSDDLTFSSGGSTTRGWAATRARYKERYPTAERMGRLEFDRLEVRLLGNDAALVLGRWCLRPDDDSRGGNFSLVFRRMGNRWVIVHDHTSVSTPGQASAPSSAL